MFDIIVLTRMNRGGVGNCIHVRNTDPILELPTPLKYDW